MTHLLLPIAQQTIKTNGTSGYVIGAVIALLILCYLGYSLVKPEKF